MGENSDAAQVLQKMGETYAHLNSYQDRGYVETLFRPGTEQVRPSKLSFTTYFRRPNLFRFEWRDRFCDDCPVRHHVIWSDGKAAYKKDPDTKLKRVSYPLCFPNATRDIGLAVAGATGVSSSSAHTVSALLMPEVGGRKLTDMRNVVSLGEDEIDGEACYRVQNKRKNDQTELWISRSRLIVLKIAENYVISGADPLEHLESSRFKSVAGFLEWMMFRKYSGKEMRKKHPEIPLDMEDFSVQSDTFYQDVQLNIEIPNQVFTSFKIDSDK